MGGLRRLPKRLGAVTASEAGACSQGDGGWAISWAPSHACLGLGFTVAFSPWAALNHSIMLATQPQRTGKGSLQRNAVQERWTCLITPQPLCSVSQQLSFLLGLLSRHVTGVWHLAGGSSLIMLVIGQKPDVRDGPACSCELV